MSLGELLSDLRQRDIRLRADSGRLSIDAPQGTLTEQLQERIRLHKADLLSVLERGASDAESITSLPDRPAEYQCELAPAQHAFFMLDALDPGCRAYNVCSVRRVQGPLDIDLLRRAIRHVVERHEPLRTTFEFRNGKAIQVAHAAGAPNVAIADVSTTADPATEVQRRLDRGRAPRFDLAHGPLYHVDVIRVSGEDHYLVLWIHHIIADATSLDVFYADLIAAYLELRSGRVPHGDGPPLQYGDYARWQRQRLVGGLLDSQIAYWDDQLAGVAPLLTPLLGSKVSASTRASTLTAIVPAQIAAAVARVASRVRTTPFVVLLSGYVLLLARYTGSPDVPVIVPVTTRDRPETLRMMGAFVNGLVMRVSVADNGRVVDLVEQVRDVSAAALKCRDISIETLEGELRKRGRARAELSSLSRVGFNYLAEASEREMHVGDFVIDAVPVPREDSVFSFMLSVSAAEGELEARLEFRADLFEHALMQRFLSHYIALLDSMCRDILAEVSAVSFVGHGELPSLLHLEESTEIAPLDARQRGVLRLARQREGRCPTVGYIGELDEGCSAAAIQTTLGQLCDAIPILRSSIVETSVRYLEPAYLCTSSANERTPALVERQAAGSGLAGALAVLEPTLVELGRVSRPRPFAHCLIATPDGSRYFAFLGSEILLSRDAVDAHRQLFEALIGSTLREVREPDVSAADSPDAERAASGEAPAFITQTLALSEEELREVRQSSRACGVDVAGWFTGLFGLLTTIYCGPDDRPHIWRHDARGRQPRSHESQIERVSLGSEFQNRAAGIAELMRQARVPSTPSTDAVADGDSMFVLEFQDPPPTATRRDVRAATDGRVRLVVEFEERAARLTLTMDRKSFHDVFALRRLHWLARQVLSGVGRSGALSLLLEEERATLRAVNTTGAAPGIQVVHRLVEQQARRTPDTIAIRAGDRCLTYAELDRRSSQLAARICQQPREARGIVGVSTARTEYLPIALLAVLKAGCAYVPLDPDYPAARLEMMLERAGVSCVVADTHSARRLPAGALAVLRVDAPAAVAEADCDLPDSSPESPAYLLFTSGSSGRPKGVLVPHRAATNLLAGMTREVVLTAADVVLAVTTTSFDIAFFEIFGALTVGATVVVAQKEDVVDPVRLGRVVERSGATVLQTTPTLWRALLDAGWRGGDGLRALCGGEALPGDLAHRLRERTGAVWNLYGPTETTVWSTAHRVRHDRGRIPIGRPLANTRVYVVDGQHRLMPPGLVGELCIGGAGVSCGYLDDPDLTAERFCRLAGIDGESEPVYATGDQVRLDQSGELEFLGRSDRQVKVRGTRVEPEEIEACLRSLPGVLDAVVLASGDTGRAAALTAYVATPGAPADEARIRAHLRERLPEAMIPGAIVPVPSLPRTPNGKVDTAALAHRTPPAKLVRPTSRTEREIASAWASVLGRESCDAHATFFDVGGHSLALVQVHQILRQRLDDVRVELADLFAYPTIAGLAAHLDAHNRDGRHFVHRSPAVRGEAIAIVGISARFPGAPDVKTFWRNLAAGVESVEVLSEEALAAEGCPPEVIRDPGYVRAASTLPGIELFDAAFFRLAPREVALIDPQHRLLMECAYSCLEDAGHDARHGASRVGIFVGLGFSSYLVRHVLPQPDLLATASPFEITYGNEKDYAATRISYALGLSGPSVTVGTACSTSLVAVHYAAESLRRRECDMALAGAAKVALPQRTGYFYSEGGILSPDGHCRPFDHRAGGTVFGSGVGMVALKRLETAVRDRDAIYAVLKGSAVNNDGRAKPGYTAPSIEGQAAVIAEALEAAGVHPDSIGYVEAHGTGTRLGDPIEVAALTRAFRAGTQRSSYCALGSVKSNVGHLDHAAGMAGLIKTVGCLETRQIPPTLHFERPNEQLELERTPFYVNTATCDWAVPTPRRAGVSSFGIGGTNAHVVLEEAPPTELPVADTQWPSRALLVLSARTPTALVARAGQLAGFLESTPAASLADVAYTLQVGREPMRHRWAALVDGREAAIRACRRCPETGHDSAGERPALVFMFPGQGSQYPGMAAELYGSQGAFRRAFDECAHHLERHLDVPLAELVFGKGETARRLTRTRYVQPALFAIEYSLARTWMDWGLTPDAMIGHSLGEYVAACLGGVFSLEAALAVIDARARLMEQASEGRMAVVFAPPETVARVEGGCALAAVNAEDVTVLSGSPRAVEDVCDRLAVLGTRTRLLDGRQGFHSPLMDEVVPLFRSVLDGITMMPPSIPFVSNVTATWITDDESVSPEYWCRHMRETVRFHDGLSLLLRDPRCTLVELGPGDVLKSLARRRVSGPGQAVLRTLARSNEMADDPTTLLEAIGEAWKRGHDVNWPALHADERRHRVHLPTYPFEGTRAWLDRPAARAPLAAPDQPVRHTIDNAFFLPSWRQSRLPDRGSPPPSVDSVSLVFAHDRDGSLGRQCLQRLAAAGRPVVAAYPPGARPPEGPFEACEVDPFHAEDFVRLVSGLATRGRRIDRVLHFWNVRSLDHQPADPLDPTFYSLLFLTQALAQHGLARPLRVAVVSNHLCAIGAADAIDPARALALGPVRVVPREYPDARWSSIDIGHVTPDGLDSLCDRLFAELDHDLPAAMVSYRDGQRLVLGLEPCALDDERNTLPESPCVVIAGGLGGLGFELARHLMRTRGARVGLVGRTPLADVLAEHAEHARAEKARRFQALRRIGDVWYAAADTARQAQLREALHAVRRRFGRLDVIVDAAGVSDGLPLFRCTRDTIEPVLSPKVRGATNVAALATELDIPRLIVCSSLAAVAGVPGQLAYCAGNAYLNALVEARRKGGLDATAISWDTWGEVGMAVTTEVPPALARARQQGLARGITNAEGVLAFDRILAGRLDHVVVAVSDPRQEDGSRATRRPHAPLRAERIESGASAVPGGHPVVLVHESTLEETLVGLWQESFQTKAIGVADDFFALGGHSLQAVHLAGRIATHVGIPVDPSVLLEHSTIRALAAHLTARHGLKSNAPAESPVVGLCDGDLALPPLWLVHPVGGQVSHYRPLGRLLHSQQRVFGLRSTESLDEPARSVEELAATYVRAVRAESESGPYYVGGSSFGGILAYEMAQQLTQAGAPVALVVMLDTPAGDQAPAGLDDDVDILAYLASALPAAGLTADVLRSRPPASRVAFFCSRLPAFRDGDDRPSESAVRRLLILVRSHMRTMRAYRPKAYAGPVAYFKARERRAGLDPVDPERTWCALAPATIVESVPGNHLTMHVPPHVEVLAARLNDHLNMSLLAHASQ